MAFLPSSLLLLIYASTQIPQAALAFPYPRREANSFQLSSQLTNFIPECAQPCFVSFLNVNFNSSRLGIFPDLDTLCSHNSSSGYTIGEGAVECIIGEDEAGGCSKTGVGGDDGGSVVVRKAYGMCSGQRAALPNTHATLVATLFTSGSVVLVAPSATVSSTSTTTSKPPITTTTSHTSTTSRPGTITAPTTTVPATIPITTASGSPTPVSFSTSTSSSSSLSTSNTALPASTTAAIPSATPEKKGLSKSQVAGIAGGTIGGIALFAGLCIGLAFMRKRRNRDRDSDLFPFTPESTNSLAARRFTEYSRRHGQAEKSQGSPGLFAPGGTRDGVAAKISPTFHPRVITPPPHGPTIRLVEDRREPLPTTRASRIGLAVSAEPSPATLMPPQSFNDSRHPSKLLPEKPTLALQIPQQTHSRPGQLFNFPSPPRTKNLSIMNRGRPKIEFGSQTNASSYSSSNYSEFNQASQQQYGSSNGNRQTGDTLSREFQPYLQNTPYYPENVNTPYEQNMALRKYLASDQNLHIRPLEIRRSQQQSMQPRGAYQEAKNQGMTNTYPTRPPNTYQQNPNPSQTYNRAPPQKSYNSYQRPQNTGRDSTGSATSFESFSSGDDVEVMSPGGTVTVTKTNNGAGANRRKSSKVNIKELSPVKESPSPGTPVSYPKIPGRLGTTVRMIPPPAKPDFTKVMGSGAAGVVNRKPVPVPISLQSGSLNYGNNSGEKPWRQAELVAAAMRRSNYGSIYGESPRDTLAPSAAYNTLPSQRGLLPTAQLAQTQNAPRFLQSEASNDDRISTASTNSSLLAKRRGEKLAAGLVLNQNQNQNQPQNQSQNLGNGNPNQNSKWRVLRDEDQIREAKSPGWRPQVGRQAQMVNPYRMSRDVFLDDGGFGGGKENEYGYGRGKGEDPGTPGWKPRLTPTRRGDDLFLSVQ